MDGRLLVVVRLILCFLAYGWLGTLRLESGLVLWSGADIDEAFCSSWSSHLVFFLGDGLATRDLLALSLFYLLLFLVIWIWCSTSCFRELKKSLKVLDAWTSSFFSSGKAYVLIGSFSGEAVYCTFGEFILKVCLLLYGSTLYGSIFYGAT